MSKPAHKLPGERDRFYASLVLDYAENMRWKLMAGILRSGLEPEGPHNTTDRIKRNQTITQLLAK